MSSSNEIAILAEGLSKEYRIGQFQPYRALKERLGLSRLFKNGAGSRETRPRSDRFWAVKDVSFQVEHGSILGIIGKNGAGKSTLLKLLARITEPTSGTAVIRGRIGSLLEVGTGFHPELTGRENIFLNGTVLGMSRAEVRSKFDDIVDFAGVETFIDTPVKRYSSGMQVRLAFAVAAHLEPEILLIDEVLAVGDAEFQRKCLGRMGEVASEGRTVVFVSHNMQTIRSLCDRGLLMADGRVQFDGPIEECISHYMLAAGDDSEAEVDVSGVPRPEEVDGDESFRFTSFKLIAPSHQAVVFVGEELVFELEFVVTAPLREVNIGWAVRTPDGGALFNASNIDDYGPIMELPVGRYKIRSRLNRHPLNPGLYNLLVVARCPARDLDAVSDVMAFRVDTRDKMDGFWLESKRIPLTLASEWTRPEQDRSKRLDEVGSR